MLTKIFSTVSNRLREPSSWGGISIILAMFGLSHEEASAVTDLLAAGAATASIFMGERGER